MRAGQLIERSMPARLGGDAERFRLDFDRRSFTFRHTLAHDPLFAVEQLIEVAKQTDPQHVYFDAGNVRIDQRWDQTPPCERSVEQLLERIATADAWIVLRKIDTLPQYARVLDDCIAEIEEYLGRSLRGLMKSRNALIFINSPQRITAYHIDRECSCLLQLRGEKTISVFDRGDRDVLPEIELERFWTVDNNAAIYKPELAERAAVYTLRPGSAVHLPVNAPHWVKNGPDVSVSLNINFHYHDRLLGDVYRMNHWLRRLGLRPTPPRQSVFVDRVKASAYGTARDTLALSRRARSRASAS